MTTLGKLVSSWVGHLTPRPSRGDSLDKVELPAPRVAGGMGLLGALSARRSSREFDSAALPAHVLSDLLWTANGVNRRPEGGRTAPSALNAREVDVYVVLPDAAYRHDGENQCLWRVAEVDARRVTGFQDFVDDAPLDLVYVADHSTPSVVSSEQRLLHSAVTAGAMVQNVYLFCASEGLATVVRAWFDAGALARALGLSATEHIVIAQTVGYPRTVAGS